MMAVWTQGLWKLRLLSTVQKNEEMIVEGT